MQRRESDNLGDPNLIPIMAIMAILIPILLASFVFYDVKVQDISLPKFKGGSSGGPDVQVLSLVVYVAKDTITVRQQESSGNIVNETVIKKVPYKKCENKATDCSKCEGTEYLEYDYASLYNAVRKLKDSDAFKTQESISIGAEDGIPWRVIARVIDGVRSKLEKESYGIEDDQASNPVCYYERAMKLRDKNLVEAVDPEDAETAQATGETAEDAEKKKGEDPPVPMFPKIVFVI